MTALPDPIANPRLYQGVPIKRLLAWFIDILIVWMISIAIGLLTFFVGFFFFAFILLIVSFSYRVVTLANGSATLGMRLMAIELRDVNDRRFDFSQAVLHTLGFMVSFTMPLIQLVSVVMMAGTERGQGLTDMILGSTMVNRRV